HQRIRRLLDRGQSARIRQPPNGETVILTGTRLNPAGVVDPRARRPSGAAGPLPAQRVPPPYAAGPHRDVEVRRTGCAFGEQLKIGQYLEPDQSLVAVQIRLGIPPYLQRIGPAGDDECDAEGRGAFRL